MGVEVFHICADQRQVDRWWRQALTETLAALAALRLDDHTAHWALPDDAMGLVEPVQALRYAYSTQGSLSAACAAVAAAASDPPSRRGGVLLGLLGPSRSRTLERFEQELAGFASCYCLLHQAARAGPITAPADPQNTFRPLLAVLEPIVGAEEAARYDGDKMDNVLGVLLPPEASVLDDAVRGRLEWTIDCVRLDAAAWHARWQRLDLLPGFWDELASRLGPQALTHVQQIGAVAAFAAAHDLAMLQFAT